MIIESALTIYIILFKKSKFVFSTKEQTMSNTTSASCRVLSWSTDTMMGRIPTLVICIVAAPIHVIFWIHLLFYPSVRQKGIVWLYIYLLSDLFLIFRYLLFYGQRANNVCVPITPRLYLCYFEAASKIYTNTLQSYILLGLNICRYIQIVHNHNVYVKHTGLLILSQIAIFILPAVNIAFQFVTNWTVLWRKSGSLCDITYNSTYVQIYNLIIVYIIPVSLNILFLSLCIRFIKSTGHIQHQQIRNNRRKFHRTILTQSLIFYIIWIILWSPFVISFQFINANSLPGMFISLLNYIQVAIDPIIVAVIDVRFLKAWKNTYNKIFKRTQRHIQPTTVTATITRRRLDTGLFPRSF